MIDISLHNLNSNMKKNHMKLKFMKRIWCKSLKISFLVTDRGLVEILRLHGKWKNEKTKNIVLFQNQLWRELCFWKCKISLHLRVLEFQQQEQTKKCKQNCSKNLVFLALLVWIALSKLFLRSEYDWNVYTKCLWRQFIFFNHSCTIIVQKIMQKVWWNT